MYINPLLKYLPIMHGCTCLCLRAHMLMRACAYTNTCMHAQCQKQGSEIGWPCFEDKIFYGLLTAVPFKMYWKFGRPKWILVGQMLKLVGKWPMADC